MSPPVVGCEAIWLASQRIPRNLLVGEDRRNLDPEMTP